MKKIVFVLFAFALTAKHSYSQSTSHSDCLTLQIDTKFYTMCDGYDTVPVYSAQGEIIGDTIIRKDLTNLKGTISYDKLKTLNDIELTSGSKSTFRRVELVSAKMILSHNSKSDSFGLTNNKLSDDLKRRIAILEKGDVLTVTGISFLDNGKPVTIPVRLTIDVQ